VVKGKTAEILAVGSELLTPLRSDTNALYLTGRLLEIGVAVTARVTVADEAGLLASAFRSAMTRADIVISTGGLGPTEDDLTREAAATALGRGLSRDPAILDALKARFARFGRPMAQVNEKQADVIQGATVLPNPRGTAPGQWIESDGRLLALLPGPPREMTPMFEEQLVPVLCDRAGGAVLRTRVLKIASMGESDVEQVVAPLYTTFSNPRTTILSAPGQVELHLTGEGASEEEALSRIEALASGIRERLADRIYGEDGRELHVVVLDLMKERGLTLALAESCTGGMLASRLTSVPGSSAVLERGFVTYSNRSKVETLRVDPGLIEAVGAVSGEVAQAMAAGARLASGADIGLGITGIAGPDGGTPEKPVGLVYLAMEGAAGGCLRRIHSPGGRDAVRSNACQAALEMLRRGLLRLPQL
jgi:competence/damage-inducible protein CinA-like protein